MRARITVSLKSTVLDPQGQAIQSALRGHGHSAVAAVRQGKFFDVTLADGKTGQEALAELEQIARDVLANPVMEEYTIQVLEG